MIRHSRPGITVSVRGVYLSTIRDKQGRYMLHSKKLKKSKKKIKIQKDYKEFQRFPFREHGWFWRCCVDTDLRFLSCHLKTLDAARADCSSCNTSFEPHTPRNPSSMIFTVCSFYRHHVKLWLPSWRNTFRRGHSGHR